MRDHILIVDDDRGMRALLRLALKPLPVNVEFAECGHDVMQRIEAQRPSLIVLDLVMPGMDGFHVLADLMQSPETAEIPVVIFSGFAEVERLRGTRWPAQVIDVMEKTRTMPRAFRARIESHLTNLTAQDSVAN